MMDRSDGRSAERWNEVGFMQVGLQARATLLQLVGIYMY